MNGSEIVVMVDLGSVETPNYQVIACQRDSTFEEASDTIDNSCKNSRGQRVDPGRFSGSISLDLVFSLGNVNYAYLKLANRQGNKVTLARREAGQIVQRAIAKVDSISETFPDQDTIVASTGFTIDGFVVNAWVIGVGVLGEVFIG